MVSLPWCRQAYPLKTPIRSCFSWPKALHYLPLLLGVKSKFLTRDHEDLTRPLTSVLPLQWNHAPASSLWMAPPWAQIFFHEMTMGAPSLKDLPHRQLPPLSTPTPTVSFLSKVPLITWYYVIFLLFFFSLLEGRCFIWCPSSNVE